MSGTASDVVGIFSATRLRKTVNERRMVTPEINTSRFDCYRAKEFTEDVLVYSCTVTLIVKIFLVGHLITHISQSVQIMFQYLVGLVS